MVLDLPLLAGCALVFSCIAGRKSSGPRSRRAGGLPAATALLVAGLLGAPELGSQEPTYEVPPALSAGEILLPEELRGDHHQVAEEVVNDGYMNSYRIVSDFGELETYGRSMLAIRLWEIEAIAWLSELSRGKVFLDAATRAASGQVETVVDFASRPVETVRGIGRGVGRLFERTKREVEEGVEAAKELQQKEKEKKEKRKAGAVAAEAAGPGDATAPGETRAEKTRELARKGAEVGKQYADRHFGVSAAERVGVGEVDGIPCHRLRFEPRPEPADASIEDKLRYATKGELCVSTDGSRLMQVELESVREVASSTIRIRAFRLRFEVRPQGDDAWLPAELEIRTDVKALGHNLRQHNIYRYFDYRLP